MGRNRRPDRVQLLKATPDQMVAAQAAELNLNEVPGRGLCLGRDGGIGLVRPFRAGGFSAEEGGRFAIPGKARAMAGEQYLRRQGRWGGARRIPPSHFFSRGGLSRAAW